MPRWLFALFVVASGGCSLFTSLDGLSGGDADAGSGDSSDGPHDSSSPDSEEAASGNLDYRATILADTPLAYWRLGDALGSAIVSDETGNGHDGAVVGSVAFGQPGAIVGDSDKAAQFADGAFASVGDVFGFTGGVPFSLELWLEPTATDSDWRPVLAKGDYNGYQGGYALLTNDLSDASPATVSMIFLTETDQEAGSGGEQRYSETITTGRWTHYVMTFDGQNATFYLQGALVETRAVSPAWLPTTEPFTISGVSAVHGGGTFHGFIDEVAVYGAALAPTAVQKHYRVGQGLPP